MEKYELIPEQLLYEGTITRENIYAPGKVDTPTILLTHDQLYWEKLTSTGLSPREARKTGFPFSPLLVERARTIPMGTIQNARFARHYGVALNVAGGTHHAFTDHGEGFCLLNDIAIAANYLLHTGEVNKVLIIDLDVHQGNGTAQIFRDKEEVFTFSMHCEANYPLKKEVSDLDVALSPYLEDEAYLEQLAGVLPTLFEQVKPDMAFYLSGVDVLASDKLGKLNLSMEGCKERDRMVFEQCQFHKVPVAVSLGGGYSPQIRDIVEAHCNTFRLAQDMYF